MQRARSGHYVFAQDQMSFTKVKSFLRGRARVQKRTRGGVMRWVFPVSEEEKEILRKSSASETLRLLFFKATEEGFLNYAEPKRTQMEAVKAIRKFTEWVKAKHRRDQAAS